MRTLTLACLLLASACHNQPAGAPVAAPGQGLFWTGERSPAERFELAKRSTPELIAFLRPMPKGADLHSHLGGATYADYLIESAVNGGKRFDVERSRFTDADGAGTVSMAEFLADPALIAAFRNQISVRGYLAHGGSGHDHFFQAFEHIGSAGRAPAEMLAEVLARNRYQNVQYLEIMTNPVSAELVARFRDVFAGLDLDDLEASFAPFERLVRDRTVQEAYVTYLDDMEREAAVLLESRYRVSWSDAPLVRYVAQLDRVGDLERFFVGAVLFMTGVQADSRIVGLNIVAPEDLPTARLQFDAQMRILDFLWRRLGNPGMTLHAGELSLLESPVEPMWDRIRRTIDEGHAVRIGHGVSVAWERDLPGLLQQMAETGVLVEVIPSSAEVILGVSGADHPFLMYRDAGVPVCICTDDEGVSRSNLTMEYVKIVQSYGLTYADVKALVGNCIRHALLPQAERAAQQRELESRFRAFEERLGAGFREDR